MSITDELRTWMYGHTVNCSDNRIALVAIADRIDAEHKKACDDAWDNGYEADYLGIEKWLTEHPQAMEHHGWIRLPKDADGEPWHIGDVTENGVVVNAMELDSHGWIFLCQNDIDPSIHRHHHAPTVEDVLTEFGIDWEHESDCEDRAALLKEYAAKLQLREDA